MRKRMEAEIDQGKTERKRGRPRVISDVVAMRICDLLANGRSLRQIASMPSMPARSTIQREVATNQAFSGQYRRARALAADTFADKVIEIADATLAGEHDPNAARLAIRAYQWTAGKLTSGGYGDHQRLDVRVTHDIAADHAPDWLRRRLAPKTSQNRRGK